MRYYIITESNPTPFVSDKDECYIDAASSREALQKVRANYTHPAGLYSAICYMSHEAKYMGNEPLKKWLSAKAAKMQILIEGYY